MEYKFRSDVDRLPPEVWGLISENLLKVGSDDLENLAYSSEFFQGVLASQRTTYLFKKVFPLVASSVWKKEGLEGLPVSEVLKLRGVCQHWNAVIDKLIPEKLQYFGKGSKDAEVGPKTIGLQDSNCIRMWQLVAENLLKTGSDDFENLLNSSKFFQDVLASLRTTYLFEKVFPLVASSVWKKEGLDGMPVLEVLKLRGVSKHWNTVIDKLVPEKLKYFGQESKERELARIGDAFRSVVKHIEFSHLKQFYDTDVNEATHKFLRHFESSHPGHQPNGRNPFIWGGVYVQTCHKKDKHEEEYQRYLEGVSTMLSKYGSHIYRFALYCDEDEFSEPENTLVYQKWFSHMPNLKELCFRSNFGNGLETENNLIPGWEFPKFKHIETLETEDLPETVFNPLIRENNQVSTLVIEYFLDNYDFFTFPLPKLRHLKIGWISDEDIDKISNSNVQWHLESLTIELVYGTAGFAALFQMIQDKFSSTLVSLEIRTKDDDEIDGGHHWLDCMNGRLQLPKLRKIKWCINRMKVCLDFLLGMKDNLEEISVTVDYDRTQKGTWTSGTIVQFMGFEGKMLKSNIWVLFKKMKNIEVMAKWEGNWWDSKWYSKDEWMLNNEYI